MTQHVEYWNQVQALLLSALELEPGERDDFLLQSCRGNSPLLREVESLLQVDTQILGQLDEPPCRLLPETTFSPSIGESLGPYQICRELGHGGMGTVFLAYRQDEHTPKPVAVKVLRPGLETAELAHRFRTETQILANLLHPNIARLYGVGTSQSGCPYFAMEYVEGEPIDTYCDSRRLNVDERLLLFEKVMSAVRFAHGSLVVHRDLKPGNILIDDQGEPKLLDFGIAKWLDSETLRPLTRTRIGRRLMTPEYASPEQVRAEPVTTACDIYSLGVLLYELLTGHPPYRLDSRHELEILRVVCQTEPKRPSLMTVQDTGRHSAMVVAQARRTEPRRLRRRLAGDLDNIVLMALRKEPERRFTSVEQFQKDLERHRTGLPVHARPDTVVYRTGKFVQRHSKEVAACLILLLMLTVALIDRTRQQAETARERDRAWQVSQFLIELFEVSDPSESRGNSISAREILDRGARQIETELTEDPELQATLMSTMGEVYQGLGLYEPAAQLLKTALEKRQEAHGENHLETIDSLERLAEIDALRGHYAQSENLLRRALRLSRPLLTERAPELAATRNGLAAMLIAQGQYLDAEPLLKQALDVQADHPEAFEDYWNTLVTAGHLHENLGRSGAAEHYRRRALAVARRHYHPDHPRILLSLNNLAVFLMRGDRTDEAQPLLREALDASRRQLGNHHPNLAVALNNYAAPFLRNKNFAAAEPLLAEAVEIMQTSHGDQHPLSADTMGNHARALHALGEVERAEALAWKVLENRRAMLGDDHPQVATSKMQLASFLLQTNRPSHATKLVREGLEILRLKAPENRWHQAQFETLLARCLQAIGEDSDAERWLLSNLATVTDHPRDPFHRYQRQTLEDLVQLYQHMGRHDAAAAYSQRLSDLDEFLDRSQ